MRNTVPSAYTAVPTGVPKDIGHVRRNLRSRCRNPAGHLHRNIGHVPGITGHVGPEYSLAIGYSLSNWRALTRYVDDGRIEIDNNTAERALRSVVLGRKNYLHFGSDAGGERAAVIYSLIATCKLNGIDPQAYLRYVLSHLAEHPINRVAELLPWVVAEKINSSWRAEQELARAA